MMKLTIKARLETEPEQTDALKRTMTQYNGACNYIAGVAFEHRIANKINLQKLVYHEVRERFGLSAQLTVLATRKVCEVYKRDKDIKPRFRKYGAIQYDPRILTWKGLDRISILTLEGRIKVPVVMGDYYEKMANRVRGQADLVLIKNTFYLYATVDVPEPREIKPRNELGIDLGVVNLAVDSDGKVHSGDAVNKARGKSAKLRGALQKAGTKSAKRHLKRLSGKEARFSRYTNHCISKNIVVKAQRQRSAIVLEDLKDIRKNGKRFRKVQRRRQHSWGFDQLRQFIEYKAKLAGVPVILVDPKNTSVTCPECGCVDKWNRRCRDIFVCIACGFAGPADAVAAMNIAARGAINRPIVSGDFSSHLGSSQGQIPHSLL